MRRLVSDELVDTSLGYDAPASDHAVAVFFEDLLGRAADGRLVVHHQHQFPCGGGGFD